MTIAKTRGQGELSPLLPLPHHIHTSNQPIHAGDWQVLTCPSSLRLAAEEFLQGYQAKWHREPRLQIVENSEELWFGFEEMESTMRSRFPTEREVADFTKMSDTDQVVPHTDHTHDGLADWQTAVRVEFRTEREQAGLLLVDKPEGYLLVVRPEGAYAWAPTSAGLFYALQTLEQLLQKGDLCSTTVIDWPDLPLRGVHIDAKGERPDLHGLKQTMREWSRYKLNYVLFEYEDTFPFASYPFLAAPDAYSADEIRELHDYAAAHFLTLVPLMQTIGHAEYMLRHQQFAHLREDGEITQFCSSQDAVFDLLRELIGEVAAAHPESPWIHIGGDEAWYLATCPQCADRSLQVGRGRIYVEHINRVVALVKATGKRAILWDDVLRQLDDQSDLEALDRDCLIHYWDYQTCGSPLEEDWITYLHALGFEVIGGAAMRGASGMDSAYPRFDDRYRNTADWATVAKRTGLAGVITTSWGRYGSLKPLIEPFDLGWHGALAAADQFWHVGGRERVAFDRSFAEVFLGVEVDAFLPYLTGLETDRPFALKVVSGLPVLEPLNQESIPARFLQLLKMTSWWRSEELGLARKIHLLESRLYRVQEDSFPEWERWRMYDRAGELEEQLQFVGNGMTTLLTGLTEPRWREEYVRSFTHRYAYRLGNLLRELPPVTPRDPATVKKIGTDYG